MKPFQERVTKEKEDLDAKITSLQLFWDNPIFMMLPETERQLLEKQFLVMQEYSDILGQRIGGFQ